MEFPLDRGKDRTVTLPQLWWRTIAERADQAASDARAEGRSNDAQTWERIAQACHMAADRR